MTYTIPSYLVRAGSVYQPGPGLVPLSIKQSARFLGAAYPRVTAFDSTKFLDRSPLRTGTRRAGEQGRCYTADGTNAIYVAGKVVITGQQGQVPDLADPA